MGRIHGQFFDHVACATSHSPILSFANVSTRGIVGWDDPSTNGPETPPIDQEMRALDGAKRKAGSRAASTISESEHKVLSKHSPELVPSQSL